MIRNRENLGAVGGRNAGWDFIQTHTRAEFVLSLDDDTVVDPQSLSFLVEVLQADPRAGIACGKTYTRQPSRTIMSAGIRVNRYTGGLSRLLPGRCVGAHAIREISRVISPQNIERAKRLIPERLWDDWTRWLLALGNTWRESCAFAVPTDSSGAVRINLKGREPDGRVDPGAAYDRLCDELAQALGELVNPATGGRAVSEIIKVAEQHPGEQVDELPDLIVKWTGDAPIDALTSPRVGTVSGRLPDLRTGSHATYGFLLAAAKGGITPGTLAEAHIMDLAPTIMWLMGQPVPPDVDGRPLTDLVGEGPPSATVPAEAP